jgi:hypothetical protein
MISIPIAVCGDDWVNQHTVTEQLQKINSPDPVVLDLHAEGPSLHALSIVDVVQQYLKKINRTPDGVYVTNWSNSVENIPFQRLNRHALSHFFWHSDQYVNSVPEHRTAKHLLGYFVGRRTVPRCVMLKELQQHHGDKSLLSLMHTVADFKRSQLDPLSHWCNTDEFDQWWRTVSIASLDGHTVRDQYFGNHNTNASLLSWYSEFDLELVAETYCHGDTFFVTEKTVRPMVAGKSMLIYGPQNYLKRLKNLGFCTWHSIWDESYDQLTGPARWNAIKHIINDLVRMDQEQLYQQCLPIVQHNQQQARLLANRHRPK